MSETAQNPWKQPIGAFYSKTTVPRGHKETPGTGPAGETCGSCEHLAKVKGAFKCRLMKKEWTAGRGTDVRAKDPACHEWKEGASE